MWVLNATSRALVSFNPLGKTKTLAQQAHGNPEPRDRLANLANFEVVEN